jgi:hypothetical protein
MIGHTSPAQAATHTCNSCGKTYGEAAWRRLSVSERIAAPEVRRHVIHWPEGLLIEVRRCSCGRTIAAKRRLE